MIVDYDKKVFATNLNKYMKINGIKQIDLCTRLHVSKSTVSSWCKGQKIPRMDKIQTLAEIFGVLKSDLIEDKQNGEHITANDHPYLKLTPENRLLVDSMIEQLIKAQSLN